VWDANNLKTLPRLKKACRWEAEKKLRDSTGSVVTYIKKRMTPCSVAYLQGKERGNTRMVGASKGEVLRKAR